MKKNLDSWSEVFVVDPIATPIARFLSKIGINPLYVTLCSFFTCVLAAFSFLNGQHILSSMLLFIGILLDGIDGKIARSRKKYIYLHAASDQMLDQVSFTLILILIALVNKKHLLYILLILSILYVYEVSYALRKEVEQKSGDYTRNIQIKYTNVISLLGKTENNIFNRLIRVVDKLHRFTFKYRTFPYPKTSDARFLLIFYFLNPVSIILMLMISFIIPDLTISLFLLALYVSKLEKGEKNGYSKA